MSMEDAAQVYSPPKRRSLVPRRTVSARSRGISEVRHTRDNDKRVSPAQVKASSSRPRKLQASSSRPNSAIVRSKGSVRSVLETSTSGRRACIPMIDSKPRYAVAGSRPSSRDKAPSVTSTPPSLMIEHNGAEPDGASGAAFRFLPAARF